MSTTRVGRGWLSPRFGVLGAACAALLATTVPASSAVSAADPSCPTGTPANAITKGMAVHGLTVTSGTQPDKFQGNVLGVLNDGIAPGIDMIMVQLRGSQITDAKGNVDKGIWYGMSGSPVYDAQGRLLGAVSYGFSASPSDVAGLTPGPAMMKLINGSPAKAAGAAKVALPNTTAHRLVASGALTSTQASGGLKQLPMPISVSGLSQRDLTKIANRFNIKRQLVAGGGTSTSTAATTIVPGGNLAAALAYGDAAWYAMGSATAVCGSQVLGFGHPFGWTGSSMLSMHGGDAIYIQKDNTYGSFKLANISAPVGRLVQDRLEGIAGVLGTLPPLTKVTSHVTATNGNSRNGTTMIAYRPYTALIAAFGHLYVNALVVLDKLRSGSATVQWTVKGTRADGSSWTFNRQDRFASHYSIAFESSYESYRQMQTILHNNFENVRINSVHYDGSYSPKFHALTIDKVQVKPGAKWVTLSRRSNTRVKAGSKLPVRVTLMPSSGVGGPVIANLAVSVPRSAKGSGGELVIEGGPGRSRLHATSFDDLLTKLANSPHNNTVTASLYADTKGGGRNPSSSDTQLVSDVVSGSQFGQLSIR